ncbi:MAG: hypothetical protein AMJ54_03450, partial [Deltaproteobacteria bacterium SG8_13]
FSLDAGAPEGASVDPVTGVFAWTPTEAHGPGEYGVTIRVSDGELEDFELFTITVDEVNQAPVLAPIGDRSITEGEELTFTIDGTDADLPVQTLIFGATGIPEGATFDPETRTFSWIPTEAQGSGTYFVTFSVSDGELADEELVAIDVTDINVAPIAVDDNYEVDEDDTLLVAGPGVLGNDSDADQDSLSAIWISNPANGDLTLNADGSFTYTPDLNFNGIDSFTYAANDGRVDSNMATVTIVVAPVNDAPVAADDDATTAEDTPVSIDVLSNDEDVDGDALIVSDFGQGANGIVSLNADETLLYTPKPDWFGTDSFSYTVSDGNLSDIATVTVTVTPVNDPPVANDDAVETDQDTQISVAVLSNDYDVDEDVLSVTAITNPGHGTVEINADDTITYTPAANFFGSDSFTYTTSDGLLTDTATVSVTINQTAPSTASLGDFVWHDLYHGAGHLVDGIQDTDEPGIAGVFVNLLGDDETVVASTFTDASGFYEFTDIAEGTYVVEVADDNFVSGGVLEGWWATLPNRGTDNASDSDGDPDTHRSDPVALTGGEIASDIDFGFFTTGIDLTKTGPAEAETGENIFFHFRVENIGDVVLSDGAQVHDALINPSGNHEIWSGILQPGQVVEFDRAYTATMNDGILGEVINTATAVGSPLRPDGVYLSNVTDLDQWTVEVTHELRVAIDIEKYVQVVESGQGTEGLSPGYWKQRHHFDDWVGFRPGDRYEKIFDVNASGCKSLLDALRTKGGKENALLRHSTAALLNAAHPHIDYAFSQAEIIDMVQAAFASGNYEDAKNQFEAQNEKGADLSEDSGGGSSGWMPGDGLGLDADSAPGLEVPVGETVQFTYVVTNPGEIALENVWVVDDNETPGELSDDFTPNPILDQGWNIGDSDRDGLLDPGETWFYTWTTLATEGQHANLATASGKAVDGGTVVEDTDPAHWLGMAPHKASIGDFVWNDLDKDGIQDAGEPGIEGVIVNLLDARGKKIVTTIADAQGFYQFGDLDPGNYKVEISCKNFVCGGVLSGWRSTLENQGSDEAIDSDGDRLTHRSDPVMLAAGEINTDVDFGFYRKSHSDYNHHGKKSHGWHRFFDHHHNDHKRNGRSDHHKRFGWSWNQAQSESWHEVKMRACSSWLKQFVCEVKKSDPNEDIEISLSKKGDKDFKKSRHRKR